MNRALLTLTLLCFLGGCSTTAAPGEPAESAPEVDQLQPDEFEKDDPN